MKKWIVRDVRAQDKTAWAKAPSDIADILISERFAPIDIQMKRPTFPVFSLLNSLICAGRFLMNSLLISDGDIIVLQTPVAIWGRLLHKVFCRLVEKKELKLVIIVHDLIGARKGWVKEGPELQQSQLFRLASKIVVHTEAMRAYLSDAGIPQSKLSVLEVFDYLAQSDKNLGCIPAFEKTINIAGNLSPDVTGYLRQIGHFTSVKWKLYGTGFDSESINGATIVYMGSFAPEQLLSQLHTGFGLIWYGSSLNACEWEHKDYLKIISPHKLSLYLAAGLPVIVNRDFACAQYVLKNNIGIVADTIPEAIELLQAMTKDEYDVLAQNVQKVAARLRNGFYTKRALQNV